jgi:acyl carrier protein
MDKKNFYLLIDEVCELPPGTIKGIEPIKNSDTFDSLAKLGIISLADKHYDKTIDISYFNQLETVDDLFVYLESK